MLQQLKRHILFLTLAFFPIVDIGNLQITAAPLRSVMTRSDESQTRDSSVTNPSEISRPWDSPIYFALYVANQIEDRGDKLVLLTRIASALIQAGDEECALAVLREAVALALIIEDSTKRASSLREIAIIQDEASDNRQASETLEKAVRAALEIEVPWFKISSLKKIASAQFNVQGPQQALKTLNYAAKVADNHAVIHGGYHLISVANQVCEIGEKRRALELLDRSLSIARSIDDRNDQVGPVREIALAQVMAKDKRQALKTLEHVTKLTQKMGDVNLRTVEMAKIASVQFQAGAKRKTLTLFTSILDTVSRETDEEVKPYLFSAIASAQLEAGNMIQARATLITTRTLIDEKDVEFDTIALMKIAVAQVRSGDRKQALVTFAQAIKMVDHSEVRASLKTSSFRRIASAQIEAGYGKRALITLEKSFDAFKGIEKRAVQDYESTFLIKAFLKAGSKCGALAIIEHQFGRSLSPDEAVGRMSDLSYICVLNNQNEASVQNRIRAILSNAVDMIREFEDSSDKAGTLSFAGWMLMKEGGHQSALTTLNLSLDATLNSNNAVETEQIFISLAMILATDPVPGNKLEETNRFSIAPMRPSFTIQEKQLARRVAEAMERN